ncbi:MAG TPA: hypothetical protein PK179_12050 [Spirochaetales bacterium]|nr:hypothetical protein [Spirochaetales bacterium]HPM71628.1 hypothetical protein [Spirochaetales bacterium]
MAMIKSALEIAMERTKNLKADPKALAAAEAKQEGKRLAGEYLADPTACDFQSRFAAIAKDRREAAREGAFDVFVSRIQLPTSAVAQPEAELAPVAEGLKALNVAPFGEKKIQATFEQLVGFLARYIEDAKRVEDAIRKQYAPRLKAKEQEMSARMGRPVRIDPMQDPDFAAFYKQNVGQMRDQYQAALDQAKADLAKLCGIHKDD